MRTTLLSSLMLLAAVSMQAQNIQLHYDFGRSIYSNEEAERQRMTCTLEQFKADEWGSWFYFVDIDFSGENTLAAYTEISREINLGQQSPFAAHVEFDGGLGLGAGSYQHAALVGPAWNGHNADYSTTYSVQLMYKHYFKNDAHRAYASAQLTGVWSTTFANKALTFAGFVDLWRGEKADGSGQLVMLAEPQLWWNLNSLPALRKTHISIGTEIEVSNNFVYNFYNDKTFFVNPTLALKWTL